ncbi:MAG TPA: helicase-related protein [Verrucomicrobiales bacterium]|nr:helicase-related protein [Verrucomicrobiales bacterium]
MNKPQQPVPGQRWISDTEPELGLGIIIEVDTVMVAIEFPAAGERRRYARQSAPLRRVRFHPGDHIQNAAGAETEVLSVSARDGLVYYQTAEGEVSEQALPGALSFSKPEDRLRAGHVDGDELYKLRLEALLRRAKMRQSPVRGFCGARVDLLPHQMYIASEVASRLAPRVLLADEVGLGKTIEAGLILHRLHLTGRAARVLILVPEPLVHQWFVELLRRFNLLFSLFDEERCYSIARLDKDANPFLDSQLILCSLDFLTRDGETATSGLRRSQIVSAGWDLLIVDEAHHLEWSPDQPGPAYSLVEELAATTSGVLLLTATPQQLGPEGHFARLRLLDPDRYPSLEQFMAESEHYGEVADALHRLESGAPMSREDRSLFAAKSDYFRSLCDAVTAGDKSARPVLAAALLDAFGPGRVMFRNSRRALAGFPKREVHPAPVDAGMEIKWLAALLRRLESEKVLLICRSRQLAEEIHAALLTEIQVDAGLFHEGLTLLQRDRNAAWFAADDGARILICSEIGSEGRNFQFAHHLVLYDLPENPELLEQRIGRLDRIGQTATIHIHVPSVSGSGGEVLARWYHEGLNAFEETLHGAAEIAAAVRDELRVVLAGPVEARLAGLILHTSQLREAFRRRLAAGYDLLLERNSCRPERAAEIIAPVREADADAKFEAFTLRLLDHFGMQIEEHSSRSFILRPGNLLTDSLPDIPEDGLSITFNRDRALSREDLAFVTADHPMVRGAFDLLLGGQTGNASYVIWRAGSGQALLLEAVFVVECIAPASLHADRFLPATAIRVVVDHSLQDVSGDRSLLKAKVEQGQVSDIIAAGPVRDKLLPSMLDKARLIANTKSTALTDAARAAVSAKLGAEVARLTALSQLNDHVQSAEVEALRAHESALLAAISAAQVRMDAVRLVRKS